MVDCLQEQLWIALYRLIQELLRKAVPTGVRGNRVHVAVVFYLHLELDETHLLQLVHLLDVAHVLTVVRGYVNHHRVQLHLVEVVPQLLLNAVPVHLRVLLCALDHLRHLLVGLKQRINKNARIRENRQELLRADVLVLDVQVVELLRHLRHLLRHLQAEQAKVLDGQLLGVRIHVVCDREVALIRVRLAPLLVDRLVHEAVADLVVVREQEHPLLQLEYPDIHLRLGAKLIRLYPLELLEVQVVEALEVYLLYQL